MSIDVSPETWQRIKELNGGKENTNIVEFYRHPSIDERKTFGWIDQKYDPNTGMPGPILKHAGEGGRFFRNAIWIRIRAPGDKDEIREREARDFDKLVYEKEWKRFEESEKGTEGADGTPLSVLPFLTPAQVAEFQAVGIKTAEQLANVSDVNGQKFMEFHKVRQRTRDFVAAAQGAAPLEEMRKELEERDAQIAALQKQMKEVIEAQSKKKG